MFKKIFNIIKYVYLYSLYNIKNLYIFFSGKKIIKKESNVDKVTIYINKNKKKFLDTFEKLDNCYNTNIDHLFYSNIHYKKFIECINHPIETKWKSNLLIENTPFGNVIMHYDVYKNGFAYYSDINISHSIMNAVAMKYVLIYKCRDFFMDERSLPEEHNSMPILKIIKEFEKEKENEDKNSNKNNNDESFRDFYSKLKKSDNSPFIKKRNLDNIKTKEKEKDKEYNTNKIIYLGKIINLNFLKKIANKKIIETVTNDNDIVKYTDYKKWKEQFQKENVDENSTNFQSLTDIM